MLCISPKAVSRGTALKANYTSPNLLTSCSPSSSRSGLHEWNACTTSNMRSDLAEAHSIRYKTCWQSCGNEFKLLKPHTRVSLMQQKLMTLYRTLFCSTVGTRLCGTGGYILVSIQQGAGWVSLLLSFCGATWGRTRVPLSPLLYAIFVDPVLQEMQALSHTDLLWVGPAAARLKLVGQAYADDMA